MAIPVAGAQLVVESVLKCLAGVDYKCVPPNVEISWNQPDLFLLAGSLYPRSTLTSRIIDLQAAQ